MPLLRNIAGFSSVGLIDERSGYDVMRALSEEGGGGTYLGPDQPDPVFPVSPNPVYYDPVPVRPVDPIHIDVISPDPGEVVYTLPDPNQAAVVPAVKPVKVLPLLSLAGLVLTMTGINPFGKVGKTLVFAGGLALLYFEMNGADKSPAGGTGVQQPNTQ